MIHTWKELKPFIQIIDGQEKVVLATHGLREPTEQELQAAYELQSQMVKNKDLSS